MERLLSPSVSWSGSELKLRHRGSALRPVPPMSASNGPSGVAEVGGGLPSSSCVPTAYALASDSPLDHRVGGRVLRSTLGGRSCSGGGDAAGLGRLGARGLADAQIHERDCRGTRLARRLWRRARPDRLAAAAGERRHAREQRGARSTATADRADRAAAPQVVARLVAHPEPARVAAATGRDGDGGAGAPRPAAPVRRRGRGGAAGRRHLAAHGGCTGAHAQPGADQHAGVRGICPVPADRGD